jgi:hypothetical protein
VNHPLGKVSNGVYRNTIGQTQTSFVIDIPQAKDAADYPYTKIQDYKSNNSTTAIFGPGANNQTVYRVKVMKLNNKKEFSATATQTLAQTLNKMQILYGVKPITLLQEPVAPQGHAGTFGVYQQNVKGGNEVLTQSLYIIQEKDYLVEFWITASSLSGRDKVDDMNRIDVVKRIWAPADTFLDSFAIRPLA